MIRVGLIGIGGMGGTHFNCYKNIKDAEIVAVCDVRTDMAKEKVKNENIHIYESYDELLEKENLDYVDICTPSYMHHDMSIKALEKGLHVLCEKPMSLSSKDAEEIIEAAEKSGKTFMTAHVVRFMTPYIILKNVIDSKELGNLVHLDMDRISTMPDWSWDDWMRDLSKSGGTPMDLSIHDIDFIQYTLGEPKNISGIYRKLRNNNDYIVSEMIYDNFTVSVKGAWYNYDIPFHSDYTAVFSNGVLEYKNNKITKNGKEIEMNLSDVSEDTGINISGVDGYGGEIEYFISCIKNGTKPQIVTPQSSMTSINIVERILKNSTIV